MLAGWLADRADGLVLAEARGSFTLAEVIKFVHEKWRHILVLGWLLKRVTPNYDSSLLAAAAATAAAMPAQLPAGRFYSLPSELSSTD